MTLMLRSGRRIHEECSFQTEADRIHGELCAGGEACEHRDHVKAGEEGRGVGMRMDRLEGRSGAGPCGQALSLSQGRDGTEGWRGGDVTRLAFRDVSLAAAWRMD